MTQSVLIEGSQIIAAMTPPTSKAAFNRGQLILRASDGTIIRAQTYTSEGRAEGSILYMEDLEGLLEAGHATGLPGAMPAVSGASLWVLRRGLPRRDRALTDLQMSGVLVHSPLVGQEGARLCVVNESLPEASALRDRWRDEAMATAKTHAERGAWDLAMIDGEIAQAVCRGLDAEVLGLLGLAYENCGRAKRAAGLLVMARRSRGEEFAEQVARAQEHLRGSLGPTRVAPTLSRVDLHAFSKRFPTLAPSLGRPHPCRLAAVV